ncbi:hypothetical protein PVAND_001814 [Polypedilum vanderplanki]|uniref:BED-type domain-containing protein n=1 Tax=Polypedilum vanderplanki TaxID=319348 RepID=A0A9J6BPJ4_POLVA|nr:hypothetical protein PVAND_001814 [Polypedilum vanderplanki]
MNNDDEVLMDNFNQEDSTTESTCGSGLGLSKNEVIKLLYNQDSEIELIAPEKFKSAIWERFRIIFYKGARLNYVQCIGCSLVLVYKSRTGTASLLRHRCQRFPISVYDLKLENHRAIFAAAGQLNLLNEMASTNNENIELKQEMLTDEEESEEQEQDHDDDSQFIADQTDKGLLESFSLLEKTFITGDELLLSREEIEHAKRNNDPDLFFERPRNHRHSSTWDRFEIVYYRNVRQNFAKCFSCNSIVSYKKTTGTASLIRHKCKSANQQQQQHQSNNVKIENVTGLLLASASASASTITSQPPTLTPAPPVFQHKQSTSSASVSSSTNSLTKNDQKILAIAHSKSDVMNYAEKNLVDAQIQWLCQSLISTEILSEPCYLDFLQNLIHYGADHGKQSVIKFINRETISQEIIPKKCAALQNELMNELRNTEFSISYLCWEDCHNEKYITVFAYYFTNAFVYKHKVLGTQRNSSGQNNVNNIIKIVKDIVKPYKSANDEPIKCVAENSCSDFTIYPCIISRISKVIIAAINANDDNKIFFKKIYQKAHELMCETVKYNFEDSNDEHKMKIFYSLHQFIKNNEIQNNAITKKFSNLLGILFEAIASLTEISDDGVRCVTANRVYLWHKKFLKYYSEYTCDDKIVNNIGAMILKLIKENFTNSIHELYQITVFLNPNFKSLKFLSSSERNDLLEIIRKNLKKLMSEDSTIQPPLTKKQKTSQNQTHLNDTFFEFMDLSMENIDDQVNSEIQRYMGFKLESLVDIIDFWATNDSFPSRDRFLESSQQIEALVERFSREANLSDSPPAAGIVGKIPLAYGKPSEIKVFGILYLRLLASTFSCGGTGLKTLFLRILALPTFLSLLWIFYNNIGDDSHGFFSKNSLVLNVLGFSYGVGILTTVSLFPIWRKRFVQEQLEGLYSGVTLLLSYNCYSIPFSFISSALAASVIYPLVLDPSNLENGYPFIYIFVSIWTSYMLSEQLSIFFLFFIKSPINAVVAVSYIITLSLVLASGTVRSWKGLVPILQDNAKATHSRYASELLHSAIFLSRRMHCVPKNNITCPSPKEFLLERLNFQNVTNEFIDISIAFAFAIGLAFFNMIVYLFPKKTKNT